MIWNSKSFKSHVSPHFFMSALSKVSDKKFGIGSPHDAVTFLVWTLDKLSKSHPELIKSSF